MRIRQKGQNRVTIESLYDILNESIIRSVQQIQEQYNGDYRRQIYSTLIDNSIDHGLNTGNFDIRTPADAIAGELLYMLQSFVQSHRDFSLNDSFKIQYKVLSVQHFDHNMANVPNFRPHIVGTETKKSKYPTYLTNPPEFCSFHASKCFSNLCLIVSCIIALIQLEYEEAQNYAKFIQFKKGIWHRYEKHRSESHSQIHTHLDKLLESGIDKNRLNNLNYILPILSQKFNLQFHLFEAKKNYAYKVSFPYKFSRKFRPIYLCIHDDEHASFINNIDKLFSINRSHFCFACQKYFTRKRGLRHHCKQEKRCFACCRPMFEPTFYCYNKEKQYCIDGEVFLSCLACRIQCKSYNSYQNHKLVCSRGTMFYCCNKFLYVDGENRSIEDLKKNHTCQKKCPECRDLMEDKNHQCKFKKHIPSRRLPRLGFFYFVTENRSGASCLKCRTKQCHFHSKAENETNTSVISVLTPCDKSGDVLLSQFSRYSLPKIKVKNVSVCNQFTSFWNASCALKRLSIPVLSNLRHKEYSECCPTDQFLKFLIENQIFDLTFVTCDRDSSSMLLVLKMFLENGLTPKIVQHHNQINLICLDSIKLKFVNLINFVPRESCQRNFYFPTGIISQKNIEDNYLPEFEDYLTISDTNEIISDKKRFFLSLVTDKWDFYASLIDYAFKNIEFTYNLTMSFLSESYNFQKFAFAHFKKPFSFIHPFVDSCTKVAYVFKLYQVLKLNDVPLYAINYEHSGVPFNTTRPENEYAEYLRFLSPNCHFIDGFSPAGQKRYKHLIPDVINVTEKRFYFFHGCYFHKCQNCMSHKFTKEDIEHAQKKFEEKKKRFLEVYGEHVKCFEIMWGCTWTWEKNNNPLLRDFMANHYSHRPMKRLRPRDTRKCHN